MTNKEILTNEVEESFKAFVLAQDFPCVMAKAAIKQSKVKILVLEYMNANDHNQEILDALYQFIDNYRKTKETYQSFVVIFTKTKIQDEDHFEDLFWKKLQALYDIDSRSYPYDGRVSSDPSSANFSFSLKEEAFFVVGLSPASGRLARRFEYPTMVFNLHEQFAILREQRKFENIRDVIRTKDEELNGSVNKMLADFGNKTEALQYTGKQYDSNWKCPLVIKQGSI